MNATPLGAVLTGPLGALSLLALVVCLVATELLMFFPDRRSRRGRALTGGAAMILAVVVIAQVFVRAL